MINTNNKEINRLLNLIILDIKHAESNEENIKASVNTINKIKSLINN